jgi:uncharacterized protein YjiS (DUF1127 family)
MSTIILRNPASSTLEDKTAPLAGPLRRFLDAIVASRTREAERRIAMHLATMSDQRLADLGFSAAEIKSIREGERVGSILARRARQLP